MLGCGSTQILRSATQVFTAKDKPLVGTIPTYEECAGYAEMMGHPVAAGRARRRVQDRSRQDGRRRRRAPGWCSTATRTTRRRPTSARRRRATSSRGSTASRPTPTILVDEAYFDYVTDPDHDTHIPVAVENPRVIVARTFSKAYGMAGLRMGYAIGHADTIKKMAEWDGGSGTGSLNVLGDAGRRSPRSSRTRRSSAAERARNKAVRDFTMKWFADRGMKPTDSQANFMFVNIGRPAKAFRDACRAKGVLVARDFPPFEKTHCRISFGTMEEMKRRCRCSAKCSRRRATAA